LFLQKTKAAIQIQRFARGWLARRWLCLWHNERTILATKVQAVFRGFYLRNRVLVAWMQWEYVNAAIIQSVMRMYLCRKQCVQHQRIIAIVRIQALWRGRTSRKRSDLLWLSVKAVNLQRLIRGMLARKKVRTMKIAQQKAATQIQRVFRGMEARKRIAAILLDRETDNRLECMAVLDSEEEWHRIQRDKLKARLARLQLDQEYVCIVDQTSSDS
jgi:myosin heavy subunit